MVDRRWLRAARPVVATVVGVVIALLVLGTGCDGGPPVLDADDVVVPTVTDAGAVEDFLAAYERSRTATYVLEQTWVRRAGDRALAPVPLRVVQRPPDDRLQIGGGSAIGKVDGRILRCNAVVGGEPGAVECLQDGPARDDAEMVAAEVAELADLVEGRSPAYAVAAGAEPGCFELTLRLAIASPPYGLAATFCFDEATGALRFRTVDHGDGIVDEFRASAIRADVTDADLVVGAVGALPETPVPE